MYENLEKSLRICEGACSKECIQYNTVQIDGDTCQKRLCGMAADAIEELSAIREEQKAQIILMAAEEKPRWISVEERLPEDCQDVLVALRRGEIAVDYYQHNRWGYSDVTHWMPLPEPPKEEKR